MTETVLVLPLILVLLALMLYFGLNLRRLQRVTGATRYEAWRQMDDDNGHRNAVQRTADADWLNALAFADSAEDVRVEPRFGHTREAADLLDEAITSAAPSGSVGTARDWMETMLEAAPRTRVVEVESEFGATSSPVLRGFDGPIRRHVVVLDGDWRYAPWLHWGSRHGRDVVWPMIHEVFYVDMADAWEPMAAGNALAATIWDQHVVVPAYRGPDEPPWWGN